MSKIVVLTEIKEMLNKLDKYDLDGLAATVTQGLLKSKLETKDDAIGVILKYSSDILSILKRRAVTRDILFTYLHDKNIMVQLPTTKEKLITKICELWNLEQNINKTVHDKSVSVKQNDECSASCVDTNGIDTMAQKFSQWFYELMNQNDLLSTEHFYPDACLKLNLISNSTHINEQTESPELIADLLYKTKIEHNLYFNPNLSKEGVQGRLDPHGLVMVLTCGTLHSNNMCVGIFEQVFALARDPFCDNNWKIKNTELNLRSKTENTAIPSLASNELTSKYLSLPER